MPAIPKKILVIAPSWVGDMIMSQTLFKELKLKFGAELIIDVLVNGWAYDVVKRMPEVNEIHCNPFKHGELGLGKRYSLGKKLRSYSYDQAYILPNSLKSALIPFFAKITTRIGFVGEMRYGLLNFAYKLDKAELPLMVDRFCALANNGRKPNSIMNPELVIDHINQQRNLSSLGLELSKPVICLCPAAEYGPAKRWPTAHFARLADMLQVNGYQVWVMGAAKDVELGEQVINQAKLKSNLRNLCGKTSLVDVVDLLACAKMVVSNDSGLMHVSCAAGVPVIAIYGSSSPGFTPPLSAQALISKLDIECSPCFARTCKFGHYNCLHEISPATVYKLIIDRT